MNTLNGVLAMIYCGWKQSANGRFSAMIPKVEYKKKIGRRQVGIVKTGNLHKQEDIINGK